MERCCRTDSDHRTLGFHQQRVKFLRADHQAGEVDVEHALEALSEEFLTVVEHRALRLHQHIQTGEWHTDRFDQRCIRDVDLRVMQAFKVRVG